MNKRRRHRWIARRLAEAAPLEPASCESEIQHLLHCRVRRDASSDDAAQARTRGRVLSSRAGSGPIRAGPRADCLASRRIADRDRVRARIRRPGGLLACVPAMVRRAPQRASPPPRYVQLSEPGSEGPAGSFASRWDTAQCAWRDTRSSRRDSTFRTCLPDSASVVKCQAIRAVNQA